MAKGNSKVAAISQGTATTTVTPESPSYKRTAGESVQDLIERLAQDLNKTPEEGEVPYSNSDMQAEVEAYTLTHRDVDMTDDEIIDAIRKRSEELRKSSTGTVRNGDIEIVKTVNGYNIERRKGTHGYYEVTLSERTDSKGKKWRKFRAFRSAKQAERFIRENYS